MVVDGRTADSRGVTLQQLADLLVKYGCETAYNLDGEREVSDIVYFGNQ